MGIEARGLNMNSSKKKIFMLMLVTMIVFGGALIYFTTEYFSLVKEGDAPPTPETFYQIGWLFLVVTMMAGFPAVGLGAYVMYIGSRIRVTGQWPPAGMGIQSKSCIEFGGRANLVGFGAMGLGGILVITGLCLPIWGVQFMNILGD